MDYCKEIQNVLSILLALFIVCNSLDYVVINYAFVITSYHNESIT